MGAQVTNMSAQNAFNISQQASQNFGQSFQKVKDTSAIENILSQAMSATTPQEIQNNIGKILSQVSPERQGPALQYLQNVFANMQAKEERMRLEQKEKEKEAKIQEAYAKEGLNPYLAPQINAQKVKDAAKNQRITSANNIFEGSQQQQQQPPPTTVNPSEVNNQPPIANLQNRKKELLKLTGHPDKEVSDRAKEELRAIQAEEKNQRADIRERNKEVAPLKQKIIEAADLARESIRNKSHLIEIIDRGNLNDPTWAIFANALPFNIGQRLLSNDTVEYRSGLIDEFGDLKNIFKGATRVKEVEIYEKKLADVYLTDSQKKAILKSRIDADKIHLLREDAAQEVENKYPNLSALQFNKKVNEIAKSKIDNLFNSIWDEQKSIIDRAENKKNLPLDINDPEDKQIIAQIMKEANGNFKEAEKLAKKKGYTF